MVAPPLQSLSNLQAQLDKIETLKELDFLRAEVLGKKSSLIIAIKDLSALPLEERREKGAVYHQLRQDITTLFNEKTLYLKNQEDAQKLMDDKVDMTLSADVPHTGTIHPLSQAMYEAIDILEAMNFTLTEGPDIEDDYHNFTALNMPLHHPARQEQDTFYFPKEGDIMRLLRTQTSPVQIRALKEKKPPLRIISPGRVYRSDYDQTHTPTFHQIEGLYIAKNIHMGHLKGCLIDFCRRFFNISDLPVRFRPGYFPFTEPSAEIDIGCVRHEGRMVLGGAGKDHDWLEILGSGMIHPRVLENMGLDPHEWQGFAFGMGVERLAMLKYGIFDLRAFYEGDVRWSQHYGFSPFQGLLKGMNV